MGKTAFIFPGQGAQYFGMGKDFFDKYEDSKKYFEEASKILGFDMEKMCFEENEDLNNTQYTQAAMFTVCAAILQQIEKTGTFLGMLYAGEFLDQKPVQQAAANA